MQGRICLAEVLSRISHAGKISSKVLSRIRHVGPPKCPSRVDKNEILC